MLISQLPYKKMLSISVMAHPSRERFFPYLKERLGDVPFSIDHDSEGVWPNARRAWSMFDPEAQFHVVIQDDAIVCDNFLERAEEAIYDGFRKGIHAASDAGFAVSFYFGNRSGLHGQAKEGMERGYTTMRRTPWAVAICLPTNLIPEMLEFCEGLAMPQDDARIGTFIKSKEMKVYFPLPSLISHRTGEESLVGDPGKGRQAAFFIDPQ